MAAPLTWRPLPLPALSGMPDLLISIQLGAANYVIRVTDMANTWVESLDRKAICMRAWGENTSIDPSDTPENMATFLSSIRSALDATHPDYGETYMTLSPASVSDAGEGGLTLRISRNLPGLQPLRWPIHLRKAASSATAGSLVLPLVRAHCHQMQEVDSLIGMLGQKDAVIAKLVDKLEATGTGLEHVYTSLSGKKKVSRSVSEAHVKGLAPFSKNAWKSEMDRKRSPGDATSLVRDVFGPKGAQQLDLLELDELPQLDRWWQDLQGTLQIPHNDGHPQTNKPDDDASTEGESPGGDEDGFQVQDTPPHLKSGAADKRQDIDDMSTESEDDGPSPTPPAPSAQRSRLGTIGGKKQSESDGNVGKQGRRGVGQDLGTMDAADMNNENKGATPTLGASLDTTPSVSSPRRGKLGRIGGNDDRGQDGEPRATEADFSETTGAHAESSRPRKLGIIGRGNQEKGIPATSLADDSMEGRGRLPVRDAAPSKDEPRETSTERADRRREDLKRELEKKAAAGPSKKKRKF